MQEAETQVKADELNKKKIQLQLEEYKNNHDEVKQTNESHN